MVPPTEVPNPDYISGYPRHSRDDYTSPDVHTPRNFSRGEMNVYWHGRKLNYYSAKLADIEAFFNGEGATRLSNGDAGTKQQSYSIEGFRVIYNLDWDRVIYIEIKTPDVTVEKGGKVGMTIDEIKATYKGGFIVPPNDLYGKSTDTTVDYLYVLPTTNNVASNEDYDGYRFYAQDGANVSEIDIHSMSFVID